MRETTEEQALAAEQTAREEEEQQKKEGAKDTLSQRLAQVHYFQTLVSSAEQQAASAFAAAHIKGLPQLLAGHIRGFEKSPEGTFKLYLDEVVEVGGVVFETTVGGRLGAHDVSQLTGVRALDGRQVERLCGEDDTVVAETDAEPIRLTPEAQG